MVNRNEVLKKAAPISPMGWNSWDCYGASVTEEELLANAAYMAEHLKQYGWEYVVCDIQWYEPTADSSHYHKFASLCMDEYSRLIPAENRFPSSAGGKGFAPIAEKIHAMGLKFGIHIMRGIPRQAVHGATPILGTDRTAKDIAHPSSMCPWNTDMYGVDPKEEGAQEYYDSLFALYASWGVDYVKVDDICNTRYTPQAPRCASGEVEMIQKAIQKSGRSMVLSLSPGAAQLADAAFFCQNANMWRMTDDFWDNWDELKVMFDRCKEWEEYVGEGTWPDCDMLPLGHIGIRAPERDRPDRYTYFTKDEQKTMMTLWGIFRSPLMFGGELRDNDEFTNSLLTNAGVLKMHLEGRNAREVWREDDICIWKTVTEKADTAFVAVFNLNDEEKAVRLSAKDMKLKGDAKENSFYEGLEIWTNEAVTIPGSSRIADPVVKIPAHGVVCYRFSV